MSVIELQIPMLHHKAVAEDFKNEFFKIKELIIPGSAMLDQLEFEQWLVHNANNRNENTVNSGWVVATTFFAVRKSDSKIVGIIDIRHSLENDFLKNYGGHIGYSVRPNERKKGYATEMLKMGLEYIISLNIEKVMIACFSDNISSIRTIEKNGGVLYETKPYVEEQNIKLPHSDIQSVNIYWINTLNGWWSYQAGNYQLEEMSDFFNGRAPIYENKHLEHIGGMESKQIIASFFPSHTKTMIDLGIGTGLELEEVFRRFPEIKVTGLDIADNMLKLLQEKYPDKKIEVHNESYLNYEFGNCLFDVVLSVMTLHHYDYTAKTDLYRKIHKSLKLNGVYIECDYMLSEHEYKNPQEWEDLYFSEFERLKKEQGICDDREYHYDTPCTVQNQKKMLLDAGFTNIKEVWRKKNTVILMADK